MPSIPNAAYLCAWACLSVTTSTYNKWVLDRLAFNFPMTLSCAHMAGGACVLHAYLAWRRGGWGGSKQHQTKEHLADQKPLGPADPEKAAATLTGHPRPVAAAWARQDLPWWLRHHGRHILPIAAMFATSVCLRNSAFAGLPLPVMQLLGSCAPLASYALSIAAGLVSLTWPGLACMVTCVCGVTIAVSGRSTVPYSGHALTRQAAGVGLEVCRSIVLQLFIRKVVEEGEASDGEKGKAHPLVEIGVNAFTAEIMSMPTPTPTQHKQLTAASVKVGQQDERALSPSHLTPSPPPLPTVLLAMYAPVCAAMLALPAAAFEVDRALADAAGRPPWFWAALAGNVATALALNLAAVTCLHRVGVVALSLTGFAKDWGLVLVSTALFGREVSPRFVAGMLITTGAVGVYGSLRRGI
jgi:hypothetical protein